MPIIAPRGQYHGADGYCSAQEYEPKPVGSLRRGQGADYHAEYDTEYQLQDILELPLLDLFQYENRRCDDEAEEECPGLYRMEIQQVLHQFCE